MTTSWDEDDNIMCGCGYGCECGCCVCEECLVIQRLIFRVLQPLTTVDVKTRPIFDFQNNYWKLKNNSPKLFDVCPGGSQKPQLDIEKYQIHRTTL